MKIQNLPRKESKGWWRGPRASANEKMLHIWSIGNLNAVWHLGCDLSGNVGPLCLASSQVITFFFFFFFKEKIMSWQTVLFDWTTAHVNDDNWAYREQKVPFIRALDACCHPHLAWFPVSLILSLSNLINVMYCLRQTFLLATGQWIEICFLYGQCINVSW